MANEELSNRKWRELCRYTHPKSVAYDHDFCMELVTANADWFVGMADDHQRYERMPDADVEQELLELAAEDHARPVAGVHLFGDVLEADA